MPAAQTLTLADFLLARIDEDEARVDGIFQGEGDPEFFWGPDRIRAECEAKRRIVEDFLRVDSYNWGMDDIATGEMNVLERALALFASIYAAHPDYNEEWRA